MPRPGKKPGQGFGTTSTILTGRYHARTEKIKPLMTHRQFPVNMTIRCGILMLLSTLLILGACTMKPPILKIEGIEQPLTPGTIVDTRNGRAITFEQLVQQLQQARVVYIGERHTETGHHRFQLEILQALIKSGQNVRVGLEMFDHTYQSVLDQWSAGALDWQTFLKRTHWYANWKFDDRLYKDILAYIQKQHLKLIGLNIPFCIPPKIAVGGLKNLSAQDRGHLPDRIDTTNAEHRAYMQEIFKIHKIKGREDFENFYAAQCAWEDGMARAVADNLGQATMVVFAGNGHIQRKFGIPDRAFKRGQAPFLTVFLATSTAHMPLSRASGDFIWIAPPSSSKPARTLTVAPSKMR